ncbi:MAG TPA: SDR family oxidoreductase [Negativicutes bacterium]|jgi:NAD(P)H dehydrogenase (quinone)
MKIIVTGATGKLGGLVVKHLLNKTSADQIVVVARDLKKAASYIDHGIEVRYGDYNDIESLQKAFSGGDKLLLVSSSATDDTLRILQHTKVIKAAKDAQLKHIAYTGYAFAESSDRPLSYLHASTEYAIRTTNIPYTFLRNCFYTEIFVTEEIKSAVESGVLANNAGNGKLNTVTRNDLALAAATVLTEEGHENKSYNFTASKLWSFEDLASIISQVSNKNVVYKAVSFDEYKKILINAEVPEPVAMMMAGVYQAVSNGEAAKSSNDLAHFIGNPTPLVETVRQVLNN